jgi:hypothetical protein
VRRTDLTWLFFPPHFPAFPPVFFSSVLTVLPFSNHDRGIMMFMVGITSDAGMVTFGLSYLMVDVNMDVL